MKTDDEHIKKVMCTHIYDITTGAEGFPGFTCSNCKETLYMLNKQQLDYHGIDLKKKVKRRNK